MGIDFMRVDLVGLTRNAVDKTFQQWLCVEQSCELFTDIRGRGGASNMH